MRFFALLLGHPHIEKLVALGPEVLGLKGTAERSVPHIDGFFLVFDNPVIVVKIEAPVYVRFIAEIDAG